jgi:hypothetical protein
MSMTLTIYPFWGKQIGIQRELIRNIPIVEFSLGFLWGKALLSVNWGQSLRSRAQGADRSAFPFVTKEVIWWFRSPCTPTLGCLCVRSIAPCKAPSISTTKPLWGCYVIRFNLLVLDLRCRHSLQDKQVHMSRNHSVHQSHVGLCKLPIENSSIRGACVEEMSRQPELWIHFKTPNHMYIVLSFSFV